jgi:hypothetical protein
MSECMDIQCVLPRLVGRFHPSDKRLNVFRKKIMRSSAKPARDGQLTRCADRDLRKKSGMRTIVRDFNTAIPLKKDVRRATA